MFPLHLKGIFILKKKNTFLIWKRNTEFGDNTIFDISYQRSRLFNNCQNVNIPFPEKNNRNSMQRFDQIDVNISAFARAQNTYIQILNININP